MTIDQTQPLGIILAGDDVKRIRRQISPDQQRAADLALYRRGGIRNREQARPILARMSSYGEGQTIQELWAVRTLMKRWDVSATTIRHDQRRLSGSR